MPMPPPARPADYDQLSFSDAFRAARRAALSGGPQQFMWRGKPYTTQLREERRPSQAPNLPPPLGLQGISPIQAGSPFRQEMPPYDPVPAGRLMGLPAFEPVPSGRQEGLPTYEDPYLSFPYLQQVLRSSALADLLEGGEGARSTPLSPGDMQSMPQQPTRQSIPGRYGLGTAIPIRSR